MLDGDEISEWTHPEDLAQPRPGCALPPVSHPRFLLPDRQAAGQAASLGRSCTAPEPSPFWRLWLLWPALPATPRQSRSPFDVPPCSTLLGLPNRSEQKRCTKKRPGWQGNLRRYPSMNSHRSTNPGCPSGNVRERFHERAGLCTCSKRGSHQPSTCCVATDPFQASLVAASAESGRQRPPWNFRQKAAALAVSSGERTDSITSTRRDKDWPKVAACPNMSILGAAAEPSRT